MLLQITPAEVSGGVFLGGWETTALTALAVSFGIIGFAFAIALGFHYRELEEWAKTELYEIFISGLIVAVLIMFVNILFTISTNLAGGNPFEIAHSAMDMITLETMNIFLTLFLTNFFISAISTLMFSFFIPIPILPPPLPTIVTIRFGSFVSPWAGLSAMVMGVDTVFNLVSAMVALVLVEQVLLDFFRLTMLKYFLPLGVLMRTFPITRVAGATIIAVAIGAYIIYPLALIYSWDVYNHYKAVSASGSPGDPYSFAAGVTFQAIQWRVDTVINPLSALIQNFVILLALFVVVVIITLSSIRSLAGALGGDPDLFGLARLV
ncbi:MAG: hypothetical protein Sv326_0030 [Candidatus Fermentimicrarchaeum limneticum]|uniref:Uncharacterized protein n=1 Tax=Fermentimicrarchaeum limneticum TaxID=2795018 RepID=A0A7D5XB99_FERL1|nr:MAG: hypothetical protein Sv326_0030 [Candidatus Fermentimicrarchaeum limneticum]